MNTDEILRRLREGDKAEAKELLQTLLNGVELGAIARIAVRNFSHGLGHWVLELTPTTVSL